MRSKALESEAWKLFSERIDVVIGPVHIPSAATALQSLNVYSTVTFLSVDLIKAPSFTPKFKHSAGKTVLAEKTLLPALSRSAFTTFQKDAEPESGNRQQEKRKIGTNTVPVVFGPGRRCKNNTYDQTHKKADRANYAK